MMLFPQFDGGARMRWLLPISLALNVLFAGAAGAVAVRYTGTVPLARVAEIDHDAASRLGRVAATLPAADATVMQAELRADAEKIAAAQADLRLTRQALRDSLRAEPFDAGAMRAAMATARAARENFEQVLQGVIVSAAGKMSVVGRNKLADWSASRGNARTTQ